MTTIVCPKCGHENPATAANCAGCRVNLKWALENAEQFQVETQATTTDEEKEPMDKMEIATKIGELEGELSKTESEMRELERKFNSAKGNRTAGAAALLIGILGILFLSSFWALWGFLGLIGVLTFFTAITKQGNAKQAIQTSEKKIADTRAELTKLRAQLAAL